MRKEEIERASEFLNAYAARPVNATLSRHEFHWLRDPEVQGYGIGKCGIGQDDYVLTVYLHRKLSYSSAPVPRKVRIPGLAEPVETTVVSMLAPAHCVGSVTCASRIGRSDAVHDVGSLGCLVRRADPLDQNTYLLSNAHVLVFSGPAVPRIHKDPIVHLPVADVGAGAKAIATLAAWLPFTPGPGYPNVIDAAIARIDDPASVSPVIPGIGIPKGVTANPWVDMPVRMHGGATGRVVEGKIKVLNYSHRIYCKQPGDSSGDFGFSRAIRTTPMAVEGDSGSIVVDINNRIVGLLYAGGRGVDSILAPIGEVFQKLGLILPNEFSEDDMAKADATLPMGFKPVVGHLYRATSILARTIWGEARNQGKTGMIAVGAVIANRAKAQRSAWGLTVEDVCLKPKQFSCWNDNDPNRAKMLAVDPSDPVFFECLETARQILAGAVVDPTGGANHYCNLANSQPDWATPDMQTAKIGSHTFFRL